MGVPSFTANVAHDGWSAADSGYGVSVAIAAGSSVTRITDTIPTGTDTLINCAIDTSTLQAIQICANKDCTLEANDGSSPTFTINIKAGIPYQWIKNSGITNPITADVTVLYVTNTEDVNLLILTAQDATP